MTRRNQELGFQHVEFEISFRDPKEKMLCRQLEIQVWNSGENLKIEMYISE